MLKFKQKSDARMVDSILIHKELAAHSTCKFHPTFLSWRSPHITDLPIGEGQVVFLAGTLPSDADVTMRLSALPLVLPKLARAAATWPLINATRARRPPKEAKLRLWSNTCLPDVHVYLFAAYFCRPLLRCTRCLPFSRNHLTNFALIFFHTHHNPNFWPELRIPRIWHKLHANFTWIHMTIARLSEDNFSCWIPHPR